MNIHGYFQMCILFDAVNPLRQFKQGAEFDERSDDPFPDYYPRDAADVTETDEEGSLQQYKPMDYMCVKLLQLPAPLSLIYMVISPRYCFECKFSVEVFMGWTEGQLHKITYGKTRKTPRKQEYKWKMKKQKIPVQYACILHQLTLEDAHGEIDMGHESLRCRTYVVAFERSLPPFCPKGVDGQGLPLWFTCHLKWWMTSKADQLPSS